MGGFLSLPKVLMSAVLAVAPPKQIIDQVSCADKRAADNKNSKTRNAKNYCNISQHFLYIPF